MCYKAVSRPYVRTTCPARPLTEAPPGGGCRKLMDTGELEFFAHDAQCTGRCVSRNSGSSKYDAKIEQLNRSMLSATTFDNDLPTFAPALANTLNEHAYTVLRHAQGLSPPPPATSPAHSAADSPASSMVSDGGDRDQWSSVALSERAGGFVSNVTSGMIYPRAPLKGF